MTTFIVVVVVIIIIIIIIRKVERGLKWKTSPGGPQRENRRAAIRR